MRERDGRIAREEARASRESERRRVPAGNGAVTLLAG